MADAELVLRLWRTTRSGSPSGNGHHGHFEEVRLTVDAGRETVLDVIERAWAEVDRTIVFRHACHHASCGTCAVRVDGRERLPCITQLSDVWNGHSPLTIEPLRNAPLLRDLAIDPSPTIARLAALRLPYVRTVEADVRRASGSADDGDVGAAERFEDCIECLACVSACPVASGDPEYLGPAVLAAADRIAEEPRHEDAKRILDLVNGEHGVWQCRSVWACSAVCPSGVDPAGRIMKLRRRILFGEGGGFPAQAAHDAHLEVGA
ncbi:MAG TPA: 2Fe-2S iron-sulfur cluster-binding protein [Candidatus Limnocylindrales bacterium]|nr:2Fe-2S iron-sulfur cluster-binding protein [Candidatus Limnocylindrales bacterium]